MYDPGGGSRVANFLCKVPAHLDENDRGRTILMHTLKKIELEIPIYHTRAMCAVFYHQTAALTELQAKSHHIWAVYQCLRGDASTEITSSEIDARVQYAVEMDDPDILYDLRYRNKDRPGDTCKRFFEKLENLVSSIMAADNSCHGIAHMREFISIRDLIEQVKKDLLEGAPIPSETTVTFVFAHAKSSQNYAGKITLKHTIQKRQLSAFHTDAHYCNVFFCYMREMAIKCREDFLFLSCNDKAKIDYGEPGYALSTGVCGRKSVVPTTSTLGALDHDVNQKGSLTPTMTLACKIPESIDE